ncbi:MAG: nucleoid-associated protein, YbaB/EbfC family [Bacteroidetes bacterium RIFCSPLOWO2_02_FULL_36_8]|nr:MAG: nucleoid-associated protein, YbaB/EbfC family [Bacteroidetes bacterium RIFCSPLOWO2_02_FULL_36_8]OFY71390.1 MAG: nucleoid-associated protein, YbaB/EbfC family [Bacteroidetes bacterium RIFCSPLOWO2_12_FULL_37_12]
MDITNLFGKLQDLQGKIKEAQGKLNEIIVEAESGGGMVKVKANGLKKIISIQIEPTLANSNDLEMLQDLVVAAVNIALDKAGEAAQEKMKNTASGLLPNIPGMDLSKFGL